jgi:hypothetical protein
MDQVDAEVLTPSELAGVLDRIGSREMDPYTAANEILARALNRSFQLRTTSS